MKIKSPNQGKWEQRWHPLRQEWVVYAAHRNTRPWSGASVKDTNKAPEYDPKCYLCPGNQRANEIQNPDYDGVYIFDNDFPVVGQEAPPVDRDIKHSHHALINRRRADGIARVVCYDPRHNVSLAQISVLRVFSVFQAWRDQMLEFFNTDGINFVLIFENRGELVGVSNPHPHCQIYATNFMFSLVEREMDAALEFDVNYKKNIFKEIINFELLDGKRMIEENESACAFVPFFARYAYEVMIFPKKRHSTLATMSNEELFDLAEVFQNVIRRYDLLFNMEFPYVMSILQAPVDQGLYSNYHMHLLLQPPLRAPGLQKYLAGPEIGGGNFMSDTMPEDKALELQRVNLEDYKENF